MSPAAIHEAGHVCIAKLFSVGVTRVTLNGTYFDSRAPLSDFETLILDAGGSVACRIAGYARDDGSGGLHDHLYIDGGLTPSDVAHAWEIVKKSRDLGAWSPRVRSPMRCVSGIGHSSQCLLTRFSVMANFLVKKSIASGASTGGRGPARNKPGRPVDFEDVVELLLKVNASSTRQCRAPSTAAR